jgi:hypothetical protein
MDMAEDLDVAGAWDSVLEEVLHPGLILGEAEADCHDAVISTERHRRRPQLGLIRHPVRHFILI